MGFMHPSCNARPKPPLRKGPSPPQELEAWGGYLLITLSVQYSISTAGHINSLTVCIDKVYLVIS
jgi:hypothetical protein